MNDDLISRQAVLEQIKGWLGYELKDMTNPIYYLEKRIKALPSVTPTITMPRHLSKSDYEKTLKEIKSRGAIVLSAERIGHWVRISMDKYTQHAKYYYKCSECGEDVIGEHKFCPNCGCRMQESEE